MICVACYCSGWCLVGFDRLVVIWLEFGDFACVRLLFVLLLRLVSLLDLVLCGLVFRRLMVLVRFVFRLLRWGCFGVMLLLVLSLLFW